MGKALGIKRKASDRFLPPDPVEDGDDDFEQISQLLDIAAPRSAKRLKQGSSAAPADRLMAGGEGSHHDDEGGMLSDPDPSSGSLQSDEEAGSDSRAREISSSSRRFGAYSFLQDAEDAESDADDSQSLVESAGPQISRKLELVDVMDVLSAGDRRVLSMFRKQDRTAAASLRFADPHVAEKAERKAAYESTSSYMEGYLPQMKAVSSARTVSYAGTKRPADSQQTTAAMASSFLPTSELEKKIAKITGGASESGRQLRLLQSFYEEKLKRWSKIKSKKFRKIQKRALERRQQRRTEATAARDADTALAELELARSRERIRLRQHDASYDMRRVLDAGNDAVAGDHEDEAELAARAERLKAVMRKLPRSNLEDGDADSLSSGTSGDSADEQGSTDAGVSAAGRRLRQAAPSERRPEEPSALVSKKSSGLSARHQQQQQPAQAPVQGEKSDRPVESLFERRPPRPLPPARPPAPVAPERKPHADTARDDAAPTLPTEGSSSAGEEAAGHDRRAPAGQSGRIADRQHGEQDEDDRAGNNGWGDTEVEGNPWLETVAATARQRRSMRKDEQVRRSVVHIGPSEASDFVDDASCSSDDGEWGGAGRKRFAEAVTLAFTDRAAGDAAAVAAGGPDGPTGRTESDFASLKARMVREEMQAATSNGLLGAGLDSQEVAQLPGWGSWTGAGVDAATEAAEKRKTFRMSRPEATPRSQAGNKAARRLKRLDAGRSNVFISERTDKAQLGKYTVPEIPFPYMNKAQYDMAMAQPLGKEFNAVRVFKESIAPAVRTRAGVAIRPMRNAKKR